MEALIPLIGLVVASLFGLLFRRRKKKAVQKPPQPPQRPPVVIVPNPATDIETELHDAHTDVDSMPDDALADAWANHGNRADD